MYADTAGYAALLLRRSYADLALPGAIMDRAGDWLQTTDAHWSETDKTWTFPAGATLTFGYLQTQNDHLRYSSAEFQFIGFDELTQFPERQYRFMNSRLRRLAGVKVPIRLRGATNPIGPGKPWVKQRFLVEGLKARNDLTGEPEPRLFVPAKVSDNPALDQVEYLRSLAELDPVTRAQLLAGDWDARPPGAMFRREWFPIQDQLPLKVQASIRYWDIAATEEAPGIDPDYSVGVKLAWGYDGRFYVEDLIRRRLTPYNLERLIRSTGDTDGQGVPVVIEEEGGASGKALIDHYQRNVLPGFAVWGDRPTGSKEQRAQPLSATSEAGNLILIRGAWIGPFFDEAESFPDVDHDDQVDAMSGALHWLTQVGGGIQGGKSPWS